MTTVKAEKRQALFPKKLVDDSKKSNRFKLFELPDKTNEKYSTDDKLFKSNDVDTIERKTVDNMIEGTEVKQDFLNFYENI